MITTPESRRKMLTLARDRAIAKAARYEKVVLDTRKLLQMIEQELERKAYMYGSNDNV